MLPYQGEPDFGRLDTVLRRRGEPDRVPFYELFSNVQQQTLEALGLAEPQDGQDWWEWQLGQHITHQRALGYDYINCGVPEMGFPRKPLPTAHTAEGDRSYYLASSHTIAGRADFDAYAWPDPNKLDYSPFDRAAAQMPAGMKIIANGPGGVLENVMWLLGYEGIAFLMADDEPLVRAMYDHVGSRLVQYLGKVAEFDCVGACTLGDDMGHKTQTLVSPTVLREYVFPWHARIVTAVHAAGKPAILHACGNLDEVMDDVIACGWDAKHSYEDDILPVWEMKRRYGARITPLGGFDVDRLCRSTPDEVRAHTRTLVERCAPGGGWALGTGNSVCSYVPIENYLAMIEEGLAGRR